MLLTSTDIEQFSYYLVDTSAKLLFDMLTRAQDDWFSLWYDFSVPFEKLERRLTVHVTRSNTAVLASSLERR